MWPKSGTTIIAFLCLALTVTQSLGDTECQRFKTIGEALQFYDLPPAFFPNKVESFSCNPASVVGSTDALSLAVRLRGGGCTVTREALGVTNVLQCQQQFSAIISRRQLTNIKGVSITLTASSPPFGPFNLALVLDRVNVIQPVISKFVQFFDTTGTGSPPFPVALIPSQPPSCDSTNSAAAGVAARAGDSRDIPSLVSDIYGRILSIVVA